MSKHGLVVSLMALMLAACAQTATTTTTFTTELPTTTSTSSTTTSTVILDCPPAPYDVEYLPERASANQIPAEDLVIDNFTSVPGSHSTIWVATDGTPVVALIRGALPPEDWPGEKGEVSIDGARGVAGPFEDGTWVVAWFEEPRARCDQYTLVFYPPVEPQEVKATIESLDRTAG